MSSTNRLSVGDLVRVLDIDIRSHWEDKGILKELSPQGIPCPIGAIGKVTGFMEVNWVEVTIGDIAFCYEPNQLELIYEI